MGFRFQRRTQIIPGVRVNLSKSGASMSVGGRGAWITMGHGRTRVTGGLPGTGLFWTESVDDKAEPKQQLKQALSALGRKLPASIKMKTVNNADDVDTLVAPIDMFRMILLNFDELMTKAQRDRMQRYADKLDYDLEPKLEKLLAGLNAFEPADEEELQTKQAMHDRFEETCGKAADEAFQKARDKQVARIKFSNTKRAFGQGALIVLALIGEIFKGARR